MPGLQSIVSAWVKVNQGHGEYFGDVSSVRDAASPSSASASGPQQQVQQQMPPHGITSLSGVVFQEGGVVHHRLSSSPSTSSLSTNNALSKNASFATGATGASTSSQPQERSLLHSQLAEPIQQSALHTSVLQHQPQHLYPPSVHHRRRPPSSLSNSPFHHMSYHPKGVHQQQQAAHPQAGANAILGRRKSSASGGASVGSKRRDANTTRESEISRDVDSSAHSGSNSYKRELDAIPPHRKDNRDNIHMLSQSISSYERRGPLNGDVLDRVRDGFSLKDGSHSFRYDSFGTNDTFRRDLNNMQRQESNMESVQMSNITDSSSDIVDDRTESSNRSAAIPIPSSSRNMFGKKRLNKSHSRTDLVREMALDRNLRGKGKNSNEKLNDVDSALSSNNGSPQRNSSFLSLAMSGKDMEENELDISGTSGENKSTVGPLLTDVGSSFIAGYNISYQPSSMKSSPKIGAIPAAGMSNLSKSLHHSSPLVLVQGGSPVVGPSNLSLDMTLETNSLIHQVSTGASSSASNSIPHQMSELSSSASHLPTRNQMLQPGWFPYNSEQDHLLRASAISRRASNGSQSTVETGNLASRQSVMNQENSSNATNQGIQQVTSPLASRQLGSNTDCRRCSQMERTVMSLQADVEYLRTLELQREFVCMQCESSAGSTRKNQTKSKRSSSHLSTRLHPPSIPENPPDGKSESSAISTGSRTSSRLASSQLKRPSLGSLGGGSRSSLRGTLSVRGSRTAAFLKDASKRLSDLSTRHKRQVKVSTHERAYFQNDMHLKLDKFAMMAKNLNEEAAKRSNEVKETKATLEAVTSERNALISQVETLKARVELYEKEGVDYEKMRKEWETNELQRLSEMECERKNQDAIIRDLTSRLNLAVKTIESERRQQQQRRQIIFPSKSGSRDSSPSSPRLKAAATASEFALGEDLDSIKQTSKNTARKYQVIMDSAMDQSAKTRKEMQDHIDTLERQLHEAKLRVSGEYTPRLPSSASSTSL
ncbi:hypothetical protein ACHAWO_000943 [Cyclotella atomus]|uniref:Uncharacterized protein n=1 Tax=Cyclotella atomus TaxID=382360 RepID=A0ABD3N391_9STRA